MIEYIEEELHVERNSDEITENSADLLDSENESDKSTSNCVQLKKVLKPGHRYRLVTLEEAWKQRRQGENIMIVSIDTTASSSHLEGTSSLLGWEQRNLFAALSIQHVVDSAGSSTSSDSLGSKDSANNSSRADGNNMLQVVLLRGSAFRRAVTSHHSRAGNYE
jgi:hypothetical protein